MDIQRAIGKLESCTQTLVSTIEKHSDKIDAVNEDVHTAKGMVKAFGWVLSAMGAVALLILGSILAVLLKHLKIT